MKACDPVGGCYRCHSSIPVKHLYPCHTSTKVQFMEDEAWNTPIKKRWFLLKGRSVQMFPRLCFLHISSLHWYSIPRLQGKMEIRFSTQAIIVLLHSFCFWLISLNILKFSLMRSLQGTNISRRISHQKSLLKLFFSPNMGHVSSLEGSDAQFHHFFPIVHIDSAFVRIVWLQRSLGKKSLASRWSEAWREPLAPQFGLLLCRGGLWGRSDVWFMMLKDVERRLCWWWYMMMAMVMMCEFKSVCIAQLKSTAFGAQGSIRSWRMVLCIRFSQPHMYNVFYLFSCGTVGFVSYMYYFPVCGLSMHAPAMAGQHTAP